METEYKMPLGVAEIQQIIPHRYPFLFVDKVLDFSDRVFITGEKCVTANESFFQGHFPGRPIMPGVIILEALAQLGVLFAKLSSGGVASKRLLMFAGVDEVRFRRPVVPGDLLSLRMELIKAKTPIWKMKGVAMVGDEMAVEGILTAAEARE